MDAPFLLPSISLNFYLAKHTRSKKISALAIPTLSDSPALRKAYGPKWDNCAAKDNINPSNGKQKAPTPRPPPWGRERSSGVNIGAVWRCPGLQQGQRRGGGGGAPGVYPGGGGGLPWLAARPPPPGGQLGAPESPAGRACALPGGLQAAANLGAMAPSPLRRSRCAPGAAHRCATSRGFPLLTAPPNHGKLIMVRRGGHHCPHYREKSSDPQEQSAALFFCPCCRKAASKRGRPAPEAHPAPGTPSRPRSLAAGRGR